MIVVDASAMVEALVGRAPADGLLHALSGDVHAPHLLDVEVTSVLRGLERGGVIPPEAALTALDDFSAFTIVRHDLAPSAERVWALRHQYTAYDAAYLALAEQLRAPLVTCDRKLDSGGHTAEVRVFAGSA